MRLLTGKERDKARLVFQSLDLDKDGVIDQGGSFKCVVNEGGPNTIPNAPTLLLSPYKAVWIYFTKKKI